jgi:type IV secretion system protein VirB5
MRTSVAAAALGCLLLSHSAEAQGIPVIDTSAIAKQIEQLVEAQKQLKQLQDLHGSLNKLTGMGDIASLLSNPAIRQALPKDFSAVEGLLRGQGGMASSHRQQDEVFTPGGNAFYAQEIERIQGANAGQKSVAQQIYDAAGKRVDGLEQLRSQIGQSEDPKTTLDLQARLQVELAHANNVLKMQALRMLQQAEWQVQQERKGEAFEQEIQDNIRKLGGATSVTSPDNPTN